MPWHKGQRIEPEDIKNLRYLEEVAKRTDEIRPQVEKLWEEVKTWMRKRSP